MAGPWLGKEAVVKKGATAIGYATGVTVGIDVDLIKEYAIGDADPKVIQAGTKTFPVSLEMMYIDNAWATDVLNGATINLEVAPGGTATGNPKITVSSIILTSWELTISAEGITLESVDGEGQSMTLGTY